MTEDHRHYEEAERLLSIVDEDRLGDTMLSHGELIGMADAHATLAVADRLDQLIDAWRTRIESVPTPNLVDVNRAIRIIRRAGKVAGR